MTKSERRKPSQSAGLLLVMLLTLLAAVGHRVLPERRLTIGTPVLFSSVAHGSAHDIAGKGQANPRAMIEAGATRLGSSASRAILEVWEASAAESTSDGLGRGPSE